MVWALLGLGIPLSRTACHNFLDSQMYSTLLTLHAKPEALNPETPSLRCGLTVPDGLQHVLRVNAQSVLGHLGQGQLGVSGYGFGA